MTYIYQYSVKLLLHCLGLKMAFKPQRGEYPLASDHSLPPGYVASYCEVKYDLQLSI
jgi:hypothetical protein